MNAVVIKKIAEHRVVSARNTGSGALPIFGGFTPSGEVTIQMVFGGNGFYNAARARNWPLLWVQGDGCSGAHVTGMQTFTITGPVRRSQVAGRTIGSAWSDADADYCLLAGVLPTDIAVSRGAQTTSCFEVMESALRKTGMDFRNVVRTWFYNDRLLDWYGEFNEARTKFFVQRGVFDRLVPASTGIGACNPQGAALAAAALAVKPRHNRVYINEVSSPLQCPATDYRSSFARAVELVFPDHRLLTISGTASIAANGKSMYQDDVAKQICLTLDVVQAILQSRGMDWHNTSRAIGYFRDLQALSVFEACCRARGIPPIPMTPAHATVCRDELLFELELDAVTPTASMWL
jgi:enamine deaminase RidA (YjgF/YER057c/UK114 family)